jgi:uncharacterized Tic20 family protein
MKGKEKMKYQITLDFIASIKRLSFAIIGIKSTFIIIDFNYDGSEGSSTFN